MRSDEMRIQEIASKNNLYIVQAHSERKKWKSHTADAHVPFRFCSPQFFAHRPLRLDKEYFCHRALWWRASVDAVGA